MIEFSDGIKIRTDGELRMLCLKDGMYVVGQGMLIPVSTWDEGQKTIKEMNAKKVR